MTDPIEQCQYCKLPIWDGFSRAKSCTGPGNLSCKDNTIVLLREELTISGLRIVELDARRREGRVLLHRLVQGITEDRAGLPRQARLGKLRERVRDYLERTREPGDVLR